MIARGGGSHAVSSGPSQLNPRKDRRKRAATVQSRGFRERLGKADHGRGRAHSRRVLLLLQEQGRSVLRSAALLLHRPELAKPLGGRECGPRGSGFRRADRVRLLVTPALRGRGELLPNGGVAE